MKFNLQAEYIEACEDVLRLSLEVKSLKAEIERLTNIVRTTEVERDAGDMVISHLRNRVNWLEVGILVKDNLIAELQKAAK